MNLRFFRRSFVVAGVAFITAQLLYSPLATAADMRILIEALSTAAPVCNVQENTLESRARLTLRNNGINVRADSAAVLYVNATVGELTKSHCVVALLVQVKEYFQVPPNTTFKPAGQALAFSEVCQSGTMLWREKFGFADELSKSLEESIKNCLGQLEYK